MEEKAISELIESIVIRLSDNNIETGIAIYREISYYIGRLEDVQKQARKLVKFCLEDSGEAKIKTSHGMAGWTIPKTRVLDKEKWEQALDDNPSLRTVVDNYEKAAAILDEVQAPYKVLPPPTLFIR